MFLDNRDLLEMLLTMMPARPTDVSLILVQCCGRKLWYQDFCLLVGISVLCLFFITETLHMPGVEWLAVLDILLYLRSSLMYRWLYRTNLDSQHALSKPVPCTNTTLVVILDLLETKVVWLLVFLFFVFFFKIYLIKLARTFLLSQSYVCW